MAKIARRRCSASTIEATDIVMASPLYWYSVSATAKRYLDYWSGWLHMPDVPLKALQRGA